jgi:hypothetical protein
MASCTSCGATAFWRKWNRRAPQVAGADWVLVPREPTEEMLLAGAGPRLGGKVHFMSNEWHDLMRQSWSAMLEAAPSVSATEGGELKAEMTRSLPGGSMDDSTFSQIEDALDAIDAPMTEGGKWLSLVERIKALRPAGDEREREAFEIVRQVASMEGRTDAQTYWFGKARDLIASINAENPNG